MGFLFSVSSLVFGIWVASIPGIKTRMNFTDGSLGLSLLLSPLGALTGVMISTKFFSRIPVGKWMVTGYSLLALIMIFQINAVNRWMLWICLYIFGLLGFLNGVSANSTVSMLEKKYDRKIMSTCHGLYSIGGGISAGIAFACFSFDVPSRWQIIGVAIFIWCVMFFFARKHLLQHTNLIHSGAGLQWPSLSILGISFICMTVFMSEGCVADWSAIYIKETLHASKNLIPLGYAGFAVAMTIGRLNGDQLIARIGSKEVVIGGALLALLGFVIVVLAPTVLVAIAGFVAVGFGCSCIVPVLFSAATTIPDVSPVQGFAMVTTGGLLGFLTGPSLIGFISETLNLSAGLSLLILMTLLAAIVGWRNRFLPARNRIKSIPHDEQIY